MMKGERIISVGQLEPGKFYESCSSDESISWVFLCVSNDVTGVFVRNVKDDSPRTHQLTAIERAAIFITYVTKEYFIQVGDQFLIRSNQGNIVIKVRDLLDSHAYYNSFGDGMPERVLLSSLKDHYEGYS